MGNKKKWTRAVLGVATMGASELYYQGKKYASKAEMEQAKALDAQIAAMRASAAAQNTVQVSSDPATTQANVDQNAQINAANEEAARRRRATLANTYSNNSRLYGAMGGKNILGG